MLDAVPVCAVSLASYYTYTNTHILDIQMCQRVIKTRNVKVVIARI